MGIGGNDMRHNIFLASWLRYVGPCTCKHNHPSIMGFHVLLGVLLLCIVEFRP